MDKNKKKVSLWNMIFYIFITLYLSSVVGAMFGFNIGYKRGQIDAIRGKYKYEMKIETKQDTVYNIIKMK